MSEHPIELPSLAYIPLDEKKYKAELQLADQYQMFTGELLRLALLGIAAFGFLFKEAFITAADPARQLEGHFGPAKSCACVAMICFGLTSAFALGFRYCSSETVRLYLDGLRFTEGGERDKAAEKLNSRSRLVQVCMICKALAAVFLGLGAALTSATFVLLLY